MQVLCKGSGSLEGLLLHFSHHHERYQGRTKRNNIFIFVVNITLASMTQLLKKKFKQAATADAFTVNNK